jgi:RNA polymerase sigma factor FliA
MSQQTQHAPADSIARGKRRSQTSAARSSIRPARDKKDAKKLKASERASPAPAPTPEQQEAERRAAEERRIQQTWARYKKEPTPQLRNALMEHYLPLVQRTAQRVHQKLPATVQVDDLFSAGVLGLMDAIEAFDTDRHVRFSTFSAVRIRGAILDELRSLDWVPRLVRSNSRKLEAATRELEAELGRTPSDEEMADRLELPIGAYRDLAEDARAVMITSLAGRRPDGREAEADSPDPGPLADLRSVDPIDESQRRALKAAVTNGLSRAERLLVTLYYYENLTMREVGQVLDLSESRVSQMHTQIIKRLRASANATGTAESPLSRLAA